MDNYLLEGKDLVKDFPVKKAFFTGKVLQSLRAVDHVSISLIPGETLGIVGESGSGKSTTGEMLGDLQRPTQGKVFYKGKELRTLNEAEYREYRRNVQFIFQDPKGSMNPNALIEDIVSEPLLTLGLEKDPEERRKKAKEMIRQVGLEELVLQKYPSELSGGQCQRIVIARALISKPEVIICDEAVSALDVSVQAQILNLLKDLQKENHVAYLFITHDIGVVNYMADRIAVMKNGSIVEEGEAQRILKDPRHEYTKQLLHSIFAR